MIISCNNCDKKFDIDSKLIPDKGRLLQCGDCSHKWFFTKKITEKSDPIVKIEAVIEKPTFFKEDVLSLEVKNPKTIEFLDSVIEDVPTLEKITLQKNNKKNEIIKDDKDPNITPFINTKSFNILRLIIIFIISFIALIIILDTFQKPISMFVPNIEFILYNLYETINDILLFISDLI